jgi:multiple antibiotic resistance protein
VVLKNIHLIQKILGPVGNRVLKKVFGIILLAIAVKLFSTNLALILP